MLLFLNIITLYIEALVPSFHKPLKISSIKFFGLLSEPSGDVFTDRHRQIHREQDDLISFLLYFKIRKFS
jgi:hypothetical protein